MAGNSAEAPKKLRGPGRPFQKGQSGNLRGRPKEDPDVRNIARAHAAEAIERAIFWMRQEENAKASLVAINVILDRAFGKPLQSHEHTANDGPPIKTMAHYAAMSLEELLAERERQRASNGHDEMKH